MASLTHFLEAKLRLQVNRGNSAVDPPWKRTFLGGTVTNQRADTSDHTPGAGTKHPPGHPGDEPVDPRLDRRLRKILWEPWHKSKTRDRMLVALGVEAERARKATATGRGAWWNAGASHRHTP